MFVLSSRSLGKMQGVDPRLVNVVKDAIRVSKIDFGVSEGLRTLERQKLLLAKRATKTLKSKHLDGLAVDVFAWVGGEARWELSLYEDIAEAFREAAIENDCAIRWGAAWNVRDIRYWSRSMESAVMTYVETRRSQGRKPFIDGPHFELME